MALIGKVGAIYIADGTSTAFTDEATTKDASNTIYYITNRTKRYWDDSYPITVKKNGITITSGFIIHHAGGYIIFDTANSGSDVITVSGKYYTPTQCATFFNWKVDIEQDLKEVTTFASNGWKEQIPAVIGWSASAEGYWADSTFFDRLGSRFIVSLYVDSTTNKVYEGYTIIKKCSVDTPCDDVVKESIDFEGTGILVYHE